MGNTILENIVFDSQKYRAWHPDRIPVITLGTRTLEEIRTTNMTYAYENADIAKSGISIMGFDVYSGDFEFGYKITGKESLY